MAPPPTDLVRAPLQPDAPAAGTDLPPHYEGCFACGTLEGGLRLRLRAGPDMSVLSTFTVAPHHQGAPGLAHGGILAAAFDELLGALQVYIPEHAVTANLSTDFRRPVPVGAELFLSARLEGRDGRKLYTSGEGRLGAADGPIAVQATGLFLVVPPEHFSTYGSAGPEYGLADGDTRAHDAGRAL